jgi:hypothetical protein
MKLHRETDTEVYILLYYPTEKNRAGHAKTLTGQGRLQVTKNS